MRKTQLNRAVVSASLAAAAAVLGCGQVARAQDQFIKYYNTANAIGGFSFNAAGDTVYQANFSPNQGFTRYLNTGTWTATTFVGPTDMTNFEQSTSVAGSGSLPTLAGGGQATIGDIMLNPTSLTINRVGVGNVTYAPGTLGIVIDQPTNVTSNAVIQYNLSKVGWFYDLRQTGVAAGGGVDRNGNGTAEWNDVFEPWFSRGDMRTVAAYSGTGTSNTTRHFAFSTDGQSVYFVDSSNANVTGGLWKANLTGTGSGAITRVLTATNGITVEPSVVSSSVRNFGGGSGDQVIVIGAPDFSVNPNNGGISYVVDNGTTVSTPNTLLTQKQLQGFFETAAVPNTQATGADASGNVYFYNAGDAGVFKYDVNGRLSKVFSRAEQIAFDVTTGGGTASTATIGDMKFRDVTYTGPGGPFTIGQLNYSDSSTGIRAPIGVHLFAPGDFNRDNLVDATDIALFKTKLGLRGVVVASVGSASPFTQTNGANLKFDLNGSVNAGGVAGVAIDWKDVKIFQQYAGLSDGDVNMDFAVNGTDLSTLGANYNGANNKLFTDGNLTSVRIANSDKDTVNYADLATLAANWTGGKPPLAAVGAISAGDIDRAFAITAGGALNQYVARGSGNWSNAANWAAGVPNAAGTVAALLTKPSDDVNLNVDGSYTVGQLNFDHYFNYTLSGAGAVHMNGNGPNAEINAFAASPVISAELAVDTSTDVTVTYSADTLTVSGNLSGAGAVMTKKGPGTMLVSGPISYTGQTNINGGTLIVDSAGGDRTVNNIGGSGGNLVKNGANKLSARSINLGGNVTINAGKLEVRARVGSPLNANNNPLYVNVLSINPAAILDLNDNDIVVNNGSFTDIRAKVLAGFGNPAAPGTITSSTSDGSQILALFDNSLIGAGSWNGVSIGASAIVGKYTYFGDANMDGQVTGDDYTVIDSNLNTTPAAGIAWLSGDVNLDGLVTGDDYTTIDSNLNLGTSNPLTLSALSATAVPEPGAGLVVMGVVLPQLLRRRRSARR